MDASIQFTELFTNIKSFLWQAEIKKKERKETSSCMSEYSNYEISLLAGTRRGRKIIVVFWKNSERLCSEFRMLYKDSN